MMIRQAAQGDTRVLARLRWDLRMDDTPPDDRYAESNDHP
jgi:hypothetical protein